MYGGDLVDRGVIWLYTVEGVLMFQSNKLYLKHDFQSDSSTTASVVELCVFLSPTVFNLIEKV